MSCPVKRNNFNFRGGANDQIRVILFHAQWCGHCRTYIGSGKWKEVQGLADKFPGKFEFKDYEEQDTISGKVEEKDQDALNLIKNQGWPTIIIVRGEVPMIYKGSRDNLINYLKELIGVQSKSGGSDTKYSKAPAQCGGGKRTSKSEDYYRLKYLKYKAKYMLAKSRI